MNTDTRREKKTGRYNFIIGPTRTNFILIEETVRDRVYSKRFGMIEQLLVFVNPHLLCTNLVYLVRRLAQRHRLHTFS